MSLVRTTAVVCALLAACAYSPLRAQTAPPQPAAASSADFAALRWLEGDWRGSGPDQPAFFERYIFVNDSTIETTHYGDSTFTTVTLVTSVALRNGRIEHRYGDMLWHAAELAPTTVRFIPADPAGHGFTWAFRGMDVWTATLPAPDGADLVYRMERRTAAPRYSPPEALADGWRTAAVHRFGLPEEPLGRLTRAIRAGEYRNIHAVLIAIDGHLVYEEYFAGPDVRRGVGRLGYVVFDRTTRHDLRSVTKSVVSALVGTAVASGAIRSVDQPILDFFPEYADLQTPERRAITIRHALDMTAGLEWNEQIPYTDPRNDEIRMSRSADPTRFVLEQPVVARPGTVWNYSGGTTHLLAAIVERATGRPLLDYAREVLFEPLGITDVEWATDGQQMPSAASGLRLRPRDLARFGALYLQHGRWHDRQVLPAAWVQSSLHRVIGLTDSIIEYGDIIDETGYAHQWWHARYQMPWGTVTAHRAQGNGGQIIFLVPERDLLVVVNSGRYNQFHDAVALVLERILPWAFGQPATGKLPPGRSVTRVPPGEWPEVQLSAEQRARYTGTYNYDGEPLHVREEDGRLVMDGFGGPEAGTVHLVPMGDHVFAMGSYDNGRLTKIYYANDRIEFVVEGGHAVRLIDRSTAGHIYATAERR